MKTYVLGTMGDRILTVKKAGGEYVVTIRQKDDDKKSIKRPPKRRVFCMFTIAQYLSRVFSLFGKE